MEDRATHAGAPPRTPTIVPVAAHGRGGVWYARKTEPTTPVKGRIRVTLKDGPLLDFELATELEKRDRGKAIPGGEPPCPVCGSKMIRHVERYPAPRGGTSPFRVRLACPDEACRAWTVYDW